MEYVVISIAEARAHGIEILPTQRQSNDKTQAVIHANMVAGIDVFNQLKRYQHDDKEFINILNSPEWTPDEQAVAPSEDYGKVLALQILNKEASDEINDMDLSNSEANKVLEFYPHWENYIGKSLEKGKKVQYNNKLYKVLKGLSNIVANHTPDVTASEYAIVSNHDGTKDDPIPYEHMMLIEKDVYYTENGKLYIGIMDAPNGYDADLSTLATLAKEVK